MPSRERLPAIPAEKMTAAQRQAADDFQSARGYPMLGPFQVMLRSPEVMLRAQAMGDYLRYRNVLSRRVSELVILVTARAWTQQFEWAHHYKYAMQAGQHVQRRGCSL
jgi:4-carboxymuconolactone decarboxylase